MVLISRISGIKMEITVNKYHGTKKYTLGNKKGI
jgi:hypothetical protein